jgi:hypothetical protein
VHRLLFASLVAASVAAAHPGGHGDEMMRPPVTEDVAKHSAKLALDELVRAKKVPPTWQAVPLKAFERVYRSQGAAWLAVFENAKEKPREVYLVLDLHGDPIAGGPALDEKDAKARAQEELAGWVQRGRLPPSWATARPAHVEKRTVGAHWEWVVRFDDAAAEPKSAYVLLLPYGELVVVNQTGK